MKKIILSSAFLCLGLLFTKAQAQPGFQVHVNLGIQPAWIPPAYAGEDYYYLPDIQAYYCVPQRQFVYQEGGRWCFAAALPERYRGYDLYHGNRIAVREARPYLHDNIYRERYGAYHNNYQRFPDRRFVERQHDYRSGYGNDHHRGGRY
ncbi:MAG TPA: hypothetical protein VGM24_03830 [Puia sp.]